MIKRSLTNRMKSEVKWYYLWGYIFRIESKRDV